MVDTVDMALVNKALEEMALVQSAPFHRVLAMVLGLVLAME